MKPLVSFIIPAFQQERFIVQAVRSALDQTDARVEVIVTDDGSTDATFDRITSIRNSRLSAHRQDNGGPSAALNTCLAAAQGDWIAVLGGDDVAEPFRVAHQLVLVDRLETDAVYSLPLVIDENGEEFEDPGMDVFNPRLENWRPDRVLRKLSREGNFLCAPTAFLRRAALDKVGRFNDALIQLQDYEHAMRWSAAGFSLRVLDRPVTRYRRTSGNVSGSDRNRAMEREMGFVLGRQYEFGKPAIWRQAFPDVLEPRLDLDAPLTVIERTALYFAHPRSSAQEHGPRQLIAAMEGPSKPLSVADYMTVMNALFE